MIYQDMYWDAALFYIAAVFGFLVVMWKLTSYMAWRPLRWWFIWLYLCVVLTPWKAVDPEVYYAPAIIVAAFDFLDLGMASALEVLKPMVNAIILGSASIVFLTIILKVRAMKQAGLRPEGEADMDDAG